MVAMNKNVVVASVALLLDEEEQTRKKRRTGTIWTRPFMLRRKINGAFHTIFKELKEQDFNGLKSYVRMEVDHFEQLVHLLSPLDKRKMFQKIYSRCGNTWFFSCSLTCNIRFLLLKQKTIQISLNFFLFQQQKILGKKLQNK